MADKNVHSGHRKRLRDRAVQEGLSAFDPHQVIEFLLFYVIPRQDTSEIAHHLINEFGSVRGVLKAEETELIKIPGIGKKAAKWLSSLGLLITAYGDMQAGDRARIINYHSSLSYGECLRSRGEPPCTYLICTTPSGTIQSFSKLIDSVQWGDPDVLRLSLREAFSVQARSVIIVEYQDRDQPLVDDEYHLASAEKYAQTLDAMGAELLDIILVGRKGVISLSRMGKYDKKQFGENLSVLADNYMREEMEQAEYGDDLPELEHGL